MQLVSVKSAADLPFKGIELIKVDASFREVIIGGKLRIQSDYGLRVLVESDGTPAKRHKVIASIDGFGKRVQYHEHGFQADSDVSAMEAKGATVVRSEVSVLLDEFGAVVREATDEATQESADYPF